MATTYNDNGGATPNGSVKNFTFTFPYLKTEDVKVALNGVTQATTKYTVNVGVSPTRIEFNNNSVDSTVQESDGSPKTGVTVRVYRDTDVDAAKAVFAAGSSIRAQNLNDNQDQVLYALQEEQNQPETLTDADINPAAEIQVSKLKDGTARQLLQTDAAGTGVEWSSNIDIPGTLDVTGVVDFDSNLNVDGTLTVDGVSTLTGNVTVGGTVDGRDVAADGSKLDGIETGATADQTNAEIRAAVEAASDSNVFTDADHSKLNGIEASADVTDATNVNAAGAVMNTDSTTADIQFVIDEDDFSTNSATKVPTQQSTKAYIASYGTSTHQPLDAQLTTLAGATSGTASIIGDGSKTLAADIDELNLLDGKSVVTSVSGSSNDNQFPTAKAVNDQILAVTNSLGGFVAIANETSFPATNPDPSDNAGTIVSITDAGGVVVNGSGTATIANGAGSGNTVTITGFPSSVYSTTLADNLGLQVQTTTTLHTYTYHKLLSKEADALNAATAVSDFNNRYRVASSAPSSSLDNGDLWFNTTSGDEAMKVYNSTTSAWEVISSTGNYSILEIKDTDGSSPTLDGSVKDFKLVTKGTSNGVTPDHAAQLIVSVNGVIQEPNTGTSTPTNGFAVTGTTIKFSNNLPSNTSVFIAKIGATVDIGTPSNNTVTAAILQSNSVETAKIKDDAVNADKLANSINTEIAANTAKVTNATHTGEVTGATALTIADDVVDEANLKISNAGSDGQFLKKNSSAGGGLTWDSVPAGVGGANGVDFNDEIKSRWGTGNDLEIYHTATGHHSVINNDGAGNLQIKSPNGTQVEVHTVGSNSDYVTLRYGQADRLLTTGDGVKLVKATSEGAEIHLLEGTTNGSAYVGLACPDDKGSDASYVITLPSAAPTANGQALTATTAGVASWGNVESTKAGGAIYENSQTISTTHTLTANTNGMSAGPVTVNSGITLTIPSGATYTVV